MNRKALAAIIEYGMLKQGDTVIAAVSGGADSVALLDFLCSLSGWNLKIRACHLNHCLRGEESDRDEQFVCTMCREYGVPLDVKRVQVAEDARSQGLSLETAAREARYAFFAELAEQYSGRVATAHTLSDNAETVLLNLARGTGIAGICGIPPVRDGWVIRPLISCTRTEIEEYCAGHGLCYVTDSTNLSSDYTRNHIRRSVIPSLDRVNPDLLGAIGRMSAHLRRDAAYLERQAALATQQISTGDGLDAEQLRALDPALRSRVIAGLLEQCGAERSSDRIALVDGMLDPSSRRYVLQVGSDRYIALRNGVLRAERRERRKSEPLVPHALPKNRLDGECFALGQGKSITFSILNSEDYEIFENNSDSGLKNAVDYDKISNDIFVRSRQSGDRLHQAGRGCGKSLKKLYSELGLSGRDRLCVIADDEGVVFAQGAGVDERVKIDRRTRRVLAFLILEQETEE